MNLRKSSLGKKKKIIGSLASNIGILDNEFEELLASAKISKVWYWYKNMGMRVISHRYNSITWIYFDNVFATLQCSHLPRHHIIWGNTRLAWIYHPNYGWVEISSGENILLDAIY